MRKLRLDMSLSESGSGSSTGGLSPTRGNSSTSLAQGQGQGYGQGQRPPLGSRRSTLSRQITSEDLDDPMPTVRPFLYRSDDRMTRLNRNVNLISSLRLLDIVMLASRRL